MAVEEDVVDQVGFLSADDVGEGLVGVIDGLGSAGCTVRGDGARRQVDVDGQAGRVKAACSQLFRGGRADVRAQVDARDAGQQAGHGRRVCRVLEGLGDLPAVDGVRIVDVAFKRPFDHARRSMKGHAGDAGLVQRGLADLAQGVPVDEERVHRAVGEGKQPVIAVHQHVPPGAVRALVAHAQGDFSAVGVDNAGLQFRRIQAEIRQVIAVFRRVVGQDVLRDEGTGGLQEVRAFRGGEGKAILTLEHQRQVRCVFSSPGSLLAAPDGDGGYFSRGILGQLDGGVHPVSGNGGVLGD